MHFTAFGIYVAIYLALHLDYNYDIYLRCSIIKNLSSCREYFYLKYHLFDVIYTDDSII